MVSDIKDIDERYRKIAKVGHGNALYYPFTMALVINRSGNYGQKAWLLLYGLIETWDMIEYD
ncbi:hypothetical protein LCGC14_2786330 [marine sediment metagenome]|uniref:Uncharacterized protein n=1 Tax=marine sediment metagenome TaxID=412755 RepID=A0A0F9B0G6_9ZZZZ